jgi:hypothetical protein
MATSYPCHSRNPVDFHFGVVLAAKIYYRKTVKSSAIFCTPRVSPGFHFPRNFLRLSLSVYNIIRKKAKIMCNFLHQPLFLGVASRCNIINLIEKSKDYLTNIEHI